MNFQADELKENTTKGYDTFEECYNDKINGHPEVYGVTREMSEAY